MKIHERTEGDRRDEPDTTKHYTAMKEKHIQIMPARESRTSYNIKENIVKTRKATWMNQRAQEGK